MAATPLDEEKAKNVLRQVEFYFSDSNLPLDKFLKKAVQENEDGLVSLALVCSFARMKNHLGLNAAIKADDIPEETVLAVADVLRSSSSLRVSEDGKRVGRSTNLLSPEEAIEQLDSRTIAASPLPYDVKLEDVKSFFAQHGKVNSVRLPRHVHDKRLFCGTALIEFSEESDAKRVLVENLVFAGAELELQPKNDFDSQREKMENAPRPRLGRNDFDSQREKMENAPRPRLGRNDSDGSYPKGLIVSFKLKKQESESVEQNGTDLINNSKGCNKEEDNSKGCNKEEDNSKGCNKEEELPNTANDDGEQKVKDSGKSPDDVNMESETKTIEDQPKEIKEEVTEDVPRDSEDRDDKCPSADSNKGNKSLITREDLKQIFEKFGAVKYIDYRMGEESGYIRFEDPEAATKARAAAVLVDEGGFIVKNYIATLEALTGEAEKEYWSLLRGGQERFKGNRGNRGGRGGRYNNYNRGGGRGQGGKRSRHGDSSSEGQPNKAQKVEATA